MTPTRRLLLPAGILAGAVLVAGILVVTRDEPLADVSSDLRPWVRTLAVEPGPLQLHVSTQGSVDPRMEIDLIAEVSGRVVEVSAALEAGGFFDAGDTLVQLDDREYRANLASAEASVTRSRSELDLSRQALARIESLFGQGVVSDASLDESRSNARVAAASLRSAEASLEQARIALERTRLTAPFAGRVRERHVGVGQFVAPGSILARIYAVDFAEVRLPLSEDELAYLDLPLAYSAAGDPSLAPAVQLEADVAGRDWSWTGRIVRTEGALDPETRMVIAVARVEDPYGRNAEAGTESRMPLAVGMFVRAEIDGRRLEDVVTLPARALNPEDRVWVVDVDERLRRRDVEVLRRERERAVVTGGLAAGERVVVSAIEGPVDGMAVRLGETDPPAPETASAPPADAP